MPDEPVVGVLALQGDVREHEAALAGVGAAPVQVRRAEELEDLDGLVIPGGESTTIGRLAELYGLLEPLRKVVAEGMPVFGSCAGMVLLAREVRDGRPDQPLVGGMDTVVRRNAFGRQVDSFECEVDLEQVPGGALPAVFIRAPAVEEAGPGVEVLGRAAGKIVAVRQGALLATAFHPELTGDLRVHALFCDLVRQAGWRRQGGEVDR